MCSILICEPDLGTGEVMSLARVALQTTAFQLERRSAAYARAWQRFLEKIPSAEIMFSLPDFDLFRLVPRRARYIAAGATPAQPDSRPSLLCRRRRG